MTKSDERKGHCELCVLADLLRNDLMACAMCIISNCEADFNLLGEWKCRGDEFPVCPECQAPMKYRDTRLRHIRREGGVKLWGRIRRLFCKNCHRLHKEKWYNRTVDEILNNEKYIGDVILVKSISPGGIGSKRIKNAGFVEQYKMDHSHPALISRESFEAVQAEKKKRSNYEDTENGKKRREKRYKSSFCLPSEENIDD